MRVRAGNARGQLLPVQVHVTSVIRNAVGMTRPTEVSILPGGRPSGHVNSASPRERMGGTLTVEGREVVRARAVFARVD